MDEDMILPEGFDAGTPTAEEPTAETQDAGFDEPSEQSDEVTTPTETPTEQPDLVMEPQKLKVKYNGQELDLDAEEAAQLAQKGMNYEKAVERARQEAAQQARDEFIAGLGYEWQGKPIRTEAEYKQAIAEKDLLEKYSQLPPELAQELIESRRDREERQRERLAKEEEAKQQADYNEFFQYFESVNERRFDPQKDALPQEVVDAVKNGQSLKFAYMEHHNKELRNRLKISAQNQANSKKTPISSVTAGGGIKTEAEDLFMKGFNSI